MGLFRKSKNNAKAQEPAKTKKSKFGGRKKDLTLFERMQLEESVATASLSVVQELSDSGNSAVREVDDGLMIVVITNEMLEKAELNPNGEEFGSFAEALRAETIESIALADDLEAGVVGIIPSQETLTALDEFDFIHDLSFRWAIVPFDLGDDDRLTVLDSTVDIGRLVDMVHDQTIKIEVKDGEVVEFTEDEVESNDEPYMGDKQGEFLDDSYVHNELGDESELDVGDDEEFDEGLDDGLGVEFDGEDDDDLSYDESDYPDGEDFDSLDELDDELDVGNDEFEESVVELTVEESKEMINRAVTHSFNNMELDLSIDMSKFDDYFDSITIAQFDTTRQDNSELQTILSKLRQDANIELSRFHQDNIQTLRNKFTTSMRDIHNRLVESLDHTDITTTYGSRKHEIDEKFREFMDELEMHVANDVRKINHDYNEKREEYAENAKREALAVYDSRYRDELNRKVESVKDNIETSVKTERDASLGELYSDRRMVAQRLFDKATTALLQKLQEEHRLIAQNELQMYDAFRKDMDAYLRKHFADEVLRAKAEAEKLKQSHEAERVRQEYEQMLTTKARQLEEADERAKEAMRQLESEHKEQLSHVQADYERRIEREQRDNQNMRELLEEVTRNSSKIGEQKEEEIQHRLKLYEDTIKAKDLELQYANNRVTASHKPVKFIFGAVAAVALALGIMFGFLFGANTTTQLVQPAEKTTNTEETYSYNTSVDNVINFDELSQKDAA